ncbi:MAG TPA: pantoate--beta-alanine ligase [Acetobacteraceae bacterium]|nr:pantoate--beta-alanine ligase [Acetobacteraceae bacterium]
MKTAQTRLNDAGFEVDYLALVDGPSLRAISVRQPGARLIAAARLGSVRLIDNIAA